MGQRGQGCSNSPGEWRMSKTRFRCLLLGLFAVMACGDYALNRDVHAQAPGKMPVFEVDAAWPKLPNNWVMGTVSSLAVDRHDNVWIFHRPKSVPPALKDRAAPPIVE